MPLSKLWIKEKDKIDDKILSYILKNVYERYENV